MTPDKSDLLLLSAFSDDFGGAEVANKSSDQNGETIPEQRRFKVDCIMLLVAFGVITSAVITLTLYRRVTSFAKTLR